MLNTSPDFHVEVERIRGEYRRRAREIPADYYAPEQPAVRFAIRQRTGHVLRMLKREGFLPLSGRRILDVGCGNGDWLADFEAWGAKREDLAGIDIDAQRLARARQRLAPSARSEGDALVADLREGDGFTLPWDDATFDLVLQSTVFSSILHVPLRSALAAEIARVLRPAGIVLWYDFFVNNPGNPNVRGVGAREIRALFPTFDVRLVRVTLAPPLARRLVPVSSAIARVLEALKVLNTHYLGAIRRVAS